MIKFDLIEDRWLPIKGIAEYLVVCRKNRYTYLHKKNHTKYGLGKFCKLKISEVDGDTSRESVG